jgi:hypothetical protein
LLSQYNPITASIATVLNVRSRGARSAKFGARRGRSSGPQEPAHVLDRTWAWPSVGGLRCPTHCDLAVIFNLFGNRLDDRCCSGYNRNLVGPTEINDQRRGLLACERLRGSAKTTIEQFAAGAAADSLIFGGRLGR